MASTILRFRNPKIYQIIDQRVYRIIYANKKLKLKPPVNEEVINLQVQLYHQYLVDLKMVCQQLDISFEISDRILFMADRDVNRDYKLDNY